MTPEKLRTMPTSAIADLFQGCWLDHEVVQAILNEMARRKAEGTFPPLQTQEAQP